MRERATRVWSAALVVILATICCRGEREPATVGAAGAIDTVVTDTDRVEGALADAQMVHLLENLSLWTIERAELAAQRADVPAVRELATAIARDQRPILDRARALARTLEIAPGTATLDPQISTAYVTALDRLRSEAAANVAHLYVEQTVELHTMALGAMRDATSYAYRPEVKALIAETARTLETHLSQARALEEE